MLQAHLAALALAAFALAISGCGSSSKSTTATSAAATAATNTTATSSTSPPPTTTPATTVKLAGGKPLTHAEWLAKGDAICARLNAQLASKTVKSNAQFAIVLPEAAAYEQAELERLVKLVPPSSKAGDWQDFLGETQQWAQDSKQLGEMARAGKFTLAVPLLTATRTIHESLAHRAGHDGFKECSLV